MKGIVLLSLEVERSQGGGIQSDGRAKKGKWVR
jgi:hypothetical protein